jgi:hypothetical protein
MTFHYPFSALIGSFYVKLKTIMRKNKTLYYAGGVAVILIVLFYFGRSGQAPAPKSIADPSALPGLLTGDAPWAANNGAGLASRLQAIGLPALAQEGTALHIHEHLDIFIHGQAVPIPADIGTDDPAGFTSPLHVHDDTGIIHVESPVVQPFYLGQFFDIWGVRLTPDCIGGYCATATDTLAFYVNGALYTGNPRDLELQEHQEIAIIYGSAAETPKQIPSSYNFPAGY